MRLTEQQTYGMNTGWWVDTLAAWGPCRCKCSRMLGVGVVHQLHHGSEFWVGVLCPACDDPNTGKAFALTVRWVAFEVRAPIIEAGQRLQLVVWTRDSKVIDVEHLRMLARLFEHVDRARRIAAAKPGSWSLSRDEHGDIWAPWDPRSRQRSGSPLRYQAGRLAASTRKRTCIGCERALEPGETVMRPTAPGSTCSREGWHPDSKHISCVCLACAENVGKAEPVDVPRLRLVDG